MYLVVSTQNGRFGARARARALEFNDNWQPGRVSLTVLLCVCVSEGGFLPRSDDSELRGGLLPQSRGQRSPQDQRRDWEAAPAGQEGIPTGIQAASAGWGEETCRLPGSSEVVCSQSWRQFFRVSVSAELVKKKKMLLSFILTKETPYKQTIVKLVCTTVLVMFSMFLQVNAVVVRMVLFSFFFLITVYTYILMVSDETWQDQLFRNNFFYF